MKKASRIADQSGGVLIMTALVLVLLLGMAAFALDIGHLVGVRNELRNAADAGALAGARQLYSGVAGSVITINSDADDAASAASAANASDGSAAEIISIERGHWCFSCGSSGDKGVFTANDSLAPYTLRDLSLSHLENDQNYVNAVRVVVGRGPDKKAASFLGGIFGIDGFTAKAEAVAWLGFAGSNFKVDLPIAVCKEKVIDKGGHFRCSRGKMKHFSGDADDDSARWISDESSGIALHPGQQICTGDDHQDEDFQSLYGRWKPDEGWPTRSWQRTLPMIECDDDSHDGHHHRLAGAVSVDILWITEDKDDPDFMNIPKNFDIDANTKYTCSTASQGTLDGRKQCWADFLNAFGWTDDNGNRMTKDTAACAYQRNNVYYRPSWSHDDDDCDERDDWGGWDRWHGRDGHSGGGSGYGYNDSSSGDGIFGGDRCDGDNHWYDHHDRHDSDDHDDRQNCHSHDGISGGAPSNVVAKIPKLVR